MKYCWLCHREETAHIEFSRILDSRIVRARLLVKESIQVQHDEFEPEDLDDCESELFRLNKLFFVAFTAPTLRKVVESSTRLQSENI